MDNTDALWFEGFVKAANDAGITDRAAVARLLKVSQERALRARNPEAFDEGVNEVLKTASFTSTLLGGAGILAAGTVLGGGLKDKFVGWQEDMGDQAFQTRLGHAQQLRNRMRSQRAQAGGFGGYDAGMYGGLYGRNPQFGM